MIPYKESFATAVPQNPEVRHEILKAARTLADENEPIRARCEEIASTRNELELIRRGVVELRRKAGQMIFCELRRYGYNPDEPRIPRHNTGGGEWRRGSSAGRQYAAATPIVINQSSLTGISRIDDTTKKLANLLAEVVDQIDPEGLLPWLYGTSVHTKFAAAVRAANIPGVEVEKTFSLLSLFRYGSKYSVRPDAVLRDDAGDIVAIYDVKTGTKGLDPARVNEIRTKTRTTSDTYVIEMSIIRGTVLKYSSIDHSTLFFAG